MCFKLYTTTLIVLEINNWRQTFLQQSHFIIGTLECAREPPQTFPSNSSDDLDWWMFWVPNGLHDEQAQSSHVRCSVCPVGENDSVKKNISKAELHVKSSTDVNTAVQTALKRWQPEDLQLLWYVQWSNVRTCRRLIKESWVKVSPHRRKLIGTLTVVSGLLDATAQTETTFLTSRISPLSHNGIGIW